MDLELAGKRAVVTGGSRGIGLAVARALLAEGAAVAVVARDRDTLDAAAAALAQEGGRVAAVPADTSDERSVRELAEQVTEQLGGVDVLVNGAARVSTPGPPPRLADLTDDAVRVEFETKVLGYLRCARAFAPGMVERGWGRIINISGLHARWAGSVAGSVRNVSVAAMTKNLADELGPSGVNVTVVHPGYTVTERTPEVLAALAAAGGVDVEAARAGLAAGTSINRLVTAAEVADVITFLASPRSVAIAGDAVVVGGGHRGPIHY